MFKRRIAAGMLIFACGSYAQTTLYEADFTNEGDGFADHTDSVLPAEAPASVNGGSATSPEGRWTASYTNKPSTDTTTNEFSVNSGVLRIQDWGGEARWESFSIDVSGVDSVDITATGQTIGSDVQNATAEFFEYFYALDGGSDVPTDIPLSGDTAGSAVNYSLTSLDVSGASSLTVGFNFDVDGAGDGYEISSFSVEPAGTLVVSNGASLGGTGVIFGDVFFESGSTCQVDVAVAQTNDWLVVDGDLDLGGATLDLTGTTDSNLVKLLVSESLTNEFAALASGASVESISSLTGYFIHYDESLNIVYLNKSSQPTSSGIDLRAYLGAEGAYVEFVAYDVESDGEIKLELVDDQDAVLWEGTVPALAGPEFVARFLVPGLNAGQSYDFRVRDEVGTWWSARGVSVGAFNTEMVSMTLSGVTIQFDSIPGREYLLQWTPSLGAGWIDLKTVVASGETTRAVFEFPDAESGAGFFRAVMQ